MALPDPRSRLAGALFVILAAVLFSGKAVLIKLAYRHGADAITLIALRMLFSAPLFAVLAWWVRRREPLTPLSGRDLLVIAVMGLLGYYLAAYFDFISLQYITAGLSRLVLFLYPTFVLLYSALVFGRVVKRREMVALALSYCGIFVCVVNDLRVQPGNVMLGVSFALVSALFYAAYILGSGRLLGRAGSLRFAAYGGSAASAGVVAHFFVTSPWELLVTQPAPVYGYLVLIAVFSTVMPIVLMAEGIRRIGSSPASILGAAGPVATIVFGYAFLGEPITGFQLTGAALVLSGVLALTMARK